MKISLILSFIIMFGISSCGQQVVSELKLLNITSEKTKNLSKGMEYIRIETALPQKIHAVKIDISNPDNRVFSTPYDQRKSVTSKFAQKNNCKVAINGDFYSGSYVTSGLSVSQGKQWAGTSDSDKSSYIYFNKAQTSAEIAEPKWKRTQSEPWMETVVGGAPLLVANGKPLEKIDCVPSFCSNHPRTAVGLSKDRKTLIMVVVDGRSNRSKGASLDQLAEIMTYLGSDRALNLDGGGSTTMYVNGLNGIVNEPSDGQERVVANHLGICDIK